MQYLDIFNREYVENSPIGSLVYPRDIRYLKKLYAFNSAQISNYYRTRNFAVRNTNFINRIITHIGAYLNYDIYRYLSYIDEKLIFLGKHFRLTSDIEKGIIHYNEFFYNDTEFIFSIDMLGNVKDVEKNWKKEKSVFFLKCDKENTKLLLPLGKEDSNKSCFNFIGIDLKILAIQYREFIREQMNNEIKLTKNNFVIKYVLSNVIEDLIDFMFLNRVINKFYGLDNEEVKFKHPFKIFEPITQINRYVDDTLNVITEKKVDFLHILFNIHLMFKINAADLLILPDFIGTRQSRLALFLSRLDYMIFLYDVAKDKNRSKHFINDWKRLVKRLEQDNLDQYEFSELKMNEIKEKMYKIKNM